MALRLVEWPTEQSLGHSSSIHNNMQSVYEGTFMSWTILSICISNTFTSVSIQVQKLQYYPSWMSIRRGRTPRQIRCSDWLLQPRQSSGEVFCNLTLSPSCRQSSLWSSAPGSLGNIFLLVSKEAEAAAAWEEFSTAGSVLHCSKGYFLLLVFFRKNKKMTHFNKGPAYGLSAEVRSKVSVEVLSLSMCLKEGKYSK